MFSPAIVIATLRLQMAKHDGSASKVGEEVVKFAAAGASNELLVSVMEFGLGIAGQARRELQLRGIAE